MIFEIRNDLTNMNCSAALDLSTQLFQSKYSNNEIRMLYASSQGCNVGINMFPLLDGISTADFTTLNAMLKSLVRLFPSRTALDSRLQSTWIMQDTLQSILPAGTVVGTSDKVVINAFNTGSVLVRDHTMDANAFLVFTSMAGVGTSLNRYSFAASDDPAALSYTPTVALGWTTLADVKNDTVHAGCALASSMLNMFDAINEVKSITTGAILAAFSAMSQAQTALDAAGTNQCVVVDGYTAPECVNAARRLRYRDACFEQDAAASYAAGVIQGIKTGWL